MVTHSVTFGASSCAEGLGGLSRLNSAAASAASIPKDGGDSAGVHEDQRARGTRSEGLNLLSAIQV